MERAVLLLLILFYSTVACAETGLPRVVSLGLCADQMVARLLPPERIIAVSPYAHDPAVSPVVARVRDIPALEPSAEAVLWAGTDMVANDGHTANLHTLRLLEQLGVTVINLRWADDFPAILDNLEQAGRDLRAEGEAAAVIAEVKQRVDRLRTLPPPDPMRTALYLRPDGGTAGAHTAVDSALTLAGLRNRMAEQGRSGWFSLSLEEAVMEPPAILVTSFSDSRPDSAWWRYGEHPALKALLARSTVIDIPTRFWSCGGWPLVEAAERLAVLRQETP